MVVKQSKNRVLRTMLLAMAALALVGVSPAGAQDKPIIPPSNVGTGVMTGEAKVTSPSTGIPAALKPCVPATVHVEGDAPVVMVNTVLTGFAGPVHITADSTSECEKAEQGQGGLAIEAHGTGPTGSKLDCGPFPENPLQPKLEGEYLRVGSVLTVQASGSCTVNKFALANVIFVATFAVTATKDDPGTPTVDNWETADPEAGAPDDPLTPADDSNPIKYARLDGSFVVTP